MEQGVLTPDMIKVFIILVSAIVIFIFDWLRVDVVGILIMIVLTLTGVLSGDEATAGLSSNAVVSIIAVMIIGAGLNRTGVMDLLAKRIIKIAGKSETRIMVVISATVSFISSFMQNIGAAALFLPAVSKISKELKVPISRVLMPMGFCAIIGGCLTLVGSSPLIMLNDLMGAWWANNQAALKGASFEPLGLFSVTPVGLALLAGALTYFAFFGRYVLPRSGKSEETGRLSSQRVRKIYEDALDHAIFEVPEDFSPKRIGELGLGRRFNVTVVGIVKPSKGKVDLSPGRDSLIEPGDLVAVIASKENIEEVAQNLGFRLRELEDEFTKKFISSDYGIVQGIVPPGSSLVNHTMEELDFRDRYKVNVLALYRGDKVIHENINQLRLQAGDAMLLLGPWKKLAKIKKNLDLVFTDELKGEEERHPEKAVPALVCLAVALTLAMVFHVKLSIALFTGAIGMVLMNIISIDDAYRSVDWMTIFLLGGLIPLGTAFEKTGAANFIAYKIVGLFGEFSTITLLLIVGILTSFFSLVASNVGATVLMVPLSMNLALQAGIDPVLAGLTVGVAASNTFILPTHQVNALIMRPGGYSTKDYVRAGTGMTIIYLVIMTLVIGFLY
ncbi:MAG: SLC13 family permease [Thermodesulfobacteria bacterium]|nr:SLC13 family permease [Thermodesulfobacteriota bacterium]